MVEERQGHTRAGGIRRVDRRVLGYPEAMRFWVPAVVSAIAAGGVGVALTSGAHLPFYWLVPALVGAVIILGALAILVAMVLPSSQPKPHGYPA
jgi:hypothetical protein